MDIHKPKPWHGVREFLKEYVIIVVGVLTALGAEQAVEWRRVHGEVGEARAALHTEMRGGVRVYVTELREDGCWLRGLTAVEAWARGTRPKPPWPGLLLSTLRSSVWDVAKTGAVAHMDLDERLALANFYGAVDNQRGMVVIARSQAQDLEGYLNQDSLNPEEAHALLRLTAHIRGTAEGEIRNATVQIAAAHRLGVEPGLPLLPLYQARVDALCAAYPAPPAARP
jgi:hypothetical protein